MLTVGEAIKLLSKNGYEKANQVGSHIKFSKGDSRITIVYHSKDSEELSRKAEKQVRNALKETE